MQNVGDSGRRRDYRVTSGRRAGNGGPKVGIEIVFALAGIALVLVAFTVVFVTLARSDRRARTRSGDAGRGRSGQDAAVGYGAVTGAAAFGVGGGDPTPGHHHERGGSFGGGDGGSFGGGDGGSSGGSFGGGDGGGSF
jgi:hypothetical protein